MLFCRIPRLLVSSFAFVALASCGGGPPPAPTAFVASTFTQGNNNGACANPNSQPFSLGVSAASQPVPVMDGQTTGGNSIVNVKCRVSSQNGGFNVSLIGALGGSGNGAGTFELLGNGVTSSGGSNLNATLAIQTGQWSDQTCALTYEYHGQMVPTTPIAGGRIWGHLSCPTMMNTSGQKVLLPSGMMSNEICQADIDFQFQNCDQ